ncbi:hypothetical protein Pelo_7814 [Pelomyxa schiedti]|nr:hypothetical protein Pelo_7814 [Pelomyxa schiedti]
MQNFQTLYFKRFKLVMLFDLLVEFAKKSKCTIQCKTIPIFTRPLNQESMKNCQPNETTTASQPPPPEISAGPYPRTVCSVSYPAVLISLSSEMLNHNPRGTHTTTSREKGAGVERELPYPTCDNGEVICTAVVMMKNTRQ